MTKPLETLFAISIDRDIRVAELAELAKTDPISRTPHLGNVFPADLALQSLGIPIRLVDKNISEVDVLFKPEAKINNGELKILTDQKKVLSPYLKDHKDQATVYEHFRKLCHSDGASKTLTCSSFYLKNIEIVEPVLDMLCRYAPDQFSRMSLHDGSIVSQVAFDPHNVWFRSANSEHIKIPRRKLVTRTIEYFLEVEKCVRTGIPIQKGGQILVSAEADILLQTVVDLSRTSSTTAQNVYQCCGAEMERYALDSRKNLSEKINWYFEKLRPLFKSIPQANLVLLPTSMLRLVYLDGESYSRHKELVKLEERVQNLKSEKDTRVKLAETVQDKNLAIKLYNKPIFEVQDATKLLIENLVHVAWTPFYSTKEAKHFTQHDLFAATGKVSIPCDVMDMRLRELKPRMKKLLADYPAVRRKVFI